MGDDARTSGGCRAKHLPPEPGDRQPIRVPVCPRSSLRSVHCQSPSHRTPRCLQLVPRVGVSSVLAVEALHGVTYAMGWSTCAVNSSKIAPPGLESTTQAVFQGLWTGVGMGVGALAGGAAYHALGAADMFFGAGTLVLAATALCAARLAAHRAALRASLRASPSLVALLKD